MALAEDHDVREELAPAVSDPAFCRSILPGAAKGVRAGFVPIDLMNRTTAALKIESRSKMRYRGAVS